MTTVAEKTDFSIFFGYQIKHIFFTVNTEAFNLVLQTNYENSNFISDSNAGW